MSSTTRTRSTGRACAVCRSSSRQQIERDLASGTQTFRAISRTYNVSRDSVRRHVQAHLDVADRELVREVSPAPALDLAAALLDVAQHAREVRHDADARGDDKTALMAGAREVQARVALADRLGISTADALAEIADASDLAHAALLVLQTEPAAIEPLAAALETLGRTAWARDIRARAAEQFLKTNREVAA